MSRPACVLFDLDDTLARYDHDALVRALASRSGVAPERIEAEQLAPTAVLFVDDKSANVDAARAIGMYAHHYQDVAGLEAVLREHDLLEEATHAP